MFTRFKSKISNSGTFFDAGCKKAIFDIFFSMAIDLDIEYGGIKNLTFTVVLGRGRGIFGCFFVKNVKYRGEPIDFLENITYCIACFKTL